MPIGENTAPRLPQVAEGEALLKAQVGHHAAFEHIGGLRVRDGDALGPSLLPNAVRQVSLSEKDVVLERAFRLRSSGIYPFGFEELARGGFGHVVHPQRL